MNTFDVNLVLGLPAADPGGVSTADELLAHMDRHGISKGFVTHLAGSVHHWGEGNALLEEALADADRERLVPVPVVNAALPDGDLDWDKWASLGAHGVRACPQLYKPLGAREHTTDVLEELKERNWFIELPLQAFCGNKMPLATVGDAIGMAAQEPDVPVMLICPPRQMFYDVYAALESHANIMVDVGNLSTGTALADLVTAGLSDCLVYGSGYGPCCITPARDMVMCSPVTDDVCASVLYDNAARLLA